MLNSTSIKVVNQAKFSQRFVRPCYASYCFSSIPATIDFLLTGTPQQTLPLDVFGKLPTRYKKVVLLFIDSFGWRFFERYSKRYPFLKAFLQDGVVSKMTSQFPSTTAAHVTCIHTGLNVGQSGIYEWSYYEPLVDDMISPLLFSYVNDKFSHETLKRSPQPAAAFFPRQTFYQMLQSKGIESHVFQNENYTTSTYSEIVFRGSQVHPYRTLQEALRSLSQVLLSPTEKPGYYFLYFDKIDTTCHNFGPYSKQLDDAVDVCLRHLNDILYQTVAGKCTDTLLLMTADHGQVEVNPQQTYYLNKQIPNISRLFKTNKRGSVMVPAGSARDMFLHVKEEHLTALVPELRQRLDGRAEVYLTQDLIAQQFFGMQPPSSTFLDRVGNVVILPYKHETVWWYEEGKFAMHFQGHHGGLTPEEMEIPFMALSL
ncbi:alkaline phosphatase family protein [Tengunoibacter tsumagoiensis]|uniref:Phosphodiesterase n=1 Tax=Tengunoibacter tsumagoiensis TaxID=2014871 RepID=A0A401ZXH7_9CHLR|nr:alkaline phosphatase family protein [Tengunoibacter tsumagoiensis]GCE11556.1 phosphodiesterase [Tengunoibacter tsumagoiensis]